MYLATPSFRVSLPNRLRKWPRCNLLQSTNEVADTLNPTSSFPTLVRGGSRPDQKPWSALGQSQHCSASLKPHCATQPTVAPPTLFSLFDFYCAPHTKSTTSPLLVPSRGVQGGCPNLQISSPVVSAVGCASKRAWVALLCE